MQPYAQRACDNDHVKGGHAWPASESAPSPASGTCSRSYFLLVSRTLSHLCSTCWQHDLAQKLSYLITPSYFAQSTRALRNSLPESCPHRADSPPNEGEAPSKRPATQLMVVRNSGDADAALHSGSQQEILGSVLFSSGSSVQHAQDDKAAAAVYTACSASIATCSASIANAYWPSCVESE